MSRTICISLKDSELEILSEVRGNRISYSEVKDSALEILSEARRIRISYSERLPGACSANGGADRKSAFGLFKFICRMVDFLNRYAIRHRLMHNLGFIYLKPTFQNN